MLVSAELVEKRICDSVIDFLTQLLSRLFHRLNLTPPRPSPEQICCCSAKIKLALPYLHCWAPPSPRGTGYGDVPWVVPSPGTAVCRGWGEVIAEPCRTWRESPKGQASRLHCINPAERWRRGQFCFFSIITPLCINTPYQWGHESNSLAGSARTGAAVSSVCTRAAPALCPLFPCHPGLGGSGFTGLGAPRLGNLVQ